MTYAFIFFYYITWNREQTNTYICEICEGENKGCSKWLDLLCSWMKFWASVCLRDKSWAFILKSGKGKGFLPTWSFPFLMGLETCQCWINWTRAWPSVSLPGALFLAALHPFSAFCPEVKRLFAPAGMEPWPGVVSAGGCQSSLLQLCLWRKVSKNLTLCLTPVFEAWQFCGLSGTCRTADCKLVKVCNQKYASQKEKVKWASEMGKW